MTGTLSVAQLSEFAKANAGGSNLGEAGDMLKGHITDTLCGIIPFGSFFKNAISKLSDKILASDTGKSAATSISGFLEKALLFVSKFTKSPMASLEETFTKDNDKLQSGLSKFAESVKGKDGKALFTADELKSALHQGVKDNITIGSTLSNWSFGLMDKPKPLDIAASTYNNINNLALSKLIAELPADKRATPPDDVILKAAKIAESISGVTVTKVGKDKSEHEYAPSSTYTQGTSLSYFTRIFPADGVTAAVDSSAATFAPTAPREMTSASSVAVSPPATTPAANPRQRPRQAR